MSYKLTIYQLLLRLFGNANTNRVPNGSIIENGCGKFNRITETVLQETKKLGISHIWYTGILEHATCTDYTAFGIAKDHSAVVKGKAGSPYAIKDYYDVDPDLAENVPNRMQEFEALLARTHQAGMKVIIDFVPNHVSRQYHSDAAPCGTVDLGENDNPNHAFDPQNNFYYLPNQLFAGQFNLLKDEKEPYYEYPAKASGNNVFSALPTVNDWYETVKLNYGIDYAGGGARHFSPIPDTWNKMRDILLFWAAKGVDGFRCDMAEMVPIEFWSYAISSVKQQFKDSIFIAEIYNPAAYRSYIDFGGFDYLYDKVGMYDTLRAIVQGNEPARRISMAWQKECDILPKMLYFLENHDEQRIASRFFAGEPHKAVPAMIVVSTLTVSPVMVYAGQELGEAATDAEGFSGDDGRTTIFDYWCVESLRRWYEKELSEEQQSLRTFYQKLLNVALSEPAINHGEMFDLMYMNCDHEGFDPAKQFAFLRKSGEELILVCVNFGEQGKNLSINIPKHAFEYLKITDGMEVTPIDLLTGKHETLCLFSSQQPFPVVIEGYSGKILKLLQIESTD
jgi:glycosidase